MLDKYQLVFALLMLVCFFWAMWESAAEGPNGGGAKFYGFRFRIKGVTVTTRYNLFVILAMIPTFLLAIWVASAFDPKMGKLLLGTYPIMIVAEDFLWFLVNPFFGYRNFIPQRATWALGPWVNFGPIHFPFLYIPPLWLGFFIILV